MKKVTSHIGGNSSQMGTNDFPLITEIMGSNGKLTAVTLPDGSEALAVALMSYPAPIEVINQAIVTELTITETSFTIVDATVWTAPEKLDFTNVVAISVGIKKDSSTASLDIFITPFDSTNVAYGNSVNALNILSTTALGSSFTTPKKEITSIRGSLNIRNNSGASKTLTGVKVWLFTQ